MKLLTEQSWLRADGRKGICNTLVVAYLVECAHHVAREIQMPYRGRGAHLIGFSGCYPNDYSFRMMKSLCTHPNVGGVLLLSLGCEGFNRKGLRDAIRASGRPCELLVIQNSGGTRSTIQAGHERVEAILEEMDGQPRSAMMASELCVGTVCGGSDGTSGITANPGIGRAFDQLVMEGATCIFEETGELIGCEQIMAARAATPELAAELTASVEKAARYYTVMGHGSFAPGNADGGLTTQEEKSMGARASHGIGRSRPPGICSRLQIL